MAAGAQPPSGWGDGFESRGKKESRVEAGSGSALTGRGGSTESMDAAFCFSWGDFEIGDGEEEGLEVKRKDGWIAGWRIFGGMLVYIRYGSTPEPRG